jgi:uncharacterized protein YggT (Ycf19 family)
MMKKIRAAISRVRTQIRRFETWIFNFSDQRLTPIRNLIINVLVVGYTAYLLGMVILEKLQLLDLIIK